MKEETLCESIIIDFINGFKKRNKNEVEDLFLYGYCYWFASILKDRFDGSIMYNPILNHFACQINEKIYDIKGEIEDISKFYDWNSFKELDSCETDRLYRDCILKLSSDYSIDYFNHTCNNIKLELKEERNV